MNFDYTESMFYGMVQDRVTSPLPTLSKRASMIKITKNACWQNCPKFLTIDTYFRMDKI